MTTLAPNITNWTGQSAIGFGLGAFLGQSGHNHTHQHHAHQLTLSIVPEQDVRIYSAQQLYEARALFIPANVAHQLVSGLYLSIYIDPCHPLAMRLNAWLNIPHHICEIPNDLQQQLQQSFLTHNMLDQALIHFLQALEIETKPLASSKIQHILALLYQGMLQSDILDRQYLAQATGLSESRFSHWFCEQTGLPLRSYRKWLRLIGGIMHMRQGQALTDVAHQADFADQAHFTRTCYQLFGVRPSELTTVHGLIFFIP